MGHVGPLLSLTSFMMSDVLHLRGLSIIASICGMVKNATYIPPNWDGFGWGFFFIGVNGYMIYKLLMERAGITFTPDVRSSPPLQRRPPSQGRSHHHIPTATTMPRAPAGYD